ncbi:MAG: hypothetical protein P8166_16710 [Candidatus Thiodiazotropha sp.]|jgi:hypothetical protein
MKLSELPGGSLQAVSCHLADLIRQLKSAPDHALLRIARDVRNGNC